MVKALWAYLANLLEDHRIIYVFDRRFYRLKLSRYNPLQALAIDMLLHKKCIGLGDITSELTYPVSKNSKLICWDDLSGPYLRDHCS